MRRVFIGATGGFAALGTGYGAFVLGEAAPEWTGFVLLSIIMFAGGALFALGLAEGR